MLDYKDEIISNQQSAIIKLVREHSIEIGKLKRELEIAKSNVKEEDSHFFVVGSRVKPLALKQAKFGLLTAPTYKSECFVSICPNQQEIDELEIMLSASERENLELKRIIENQKKAILKLAKE